MKIAFIALMFATFAGAVLTLLGGIANMGKQQRGKKSATNLMIIRVGLCLILLIEMIIYSIYFK